MSYNPTLGTSNAFNPSTGLIDNSLLDSFQGKITIKNDNNQEPNIDLTSETNINTWNIKGEVSDANNGDLTFSNNGNPENDFR
jgi:hypothetical protein